MNKSENDDITTMKQNESMHIFHGMYTLEV